MRTKPAERATEVIVDCHTQMTGNRPLRGLNLFAFVILGLAPQALCHRALRALMRREPIPQSAMSWFDVHL